MDQQNNKSQEIFSKILRAGRRTYFFDVRATRAEDYYLTITESKKHTNDDGSSHYKKHKIYLYKEDFMGFKEIFDEVTNYILAEKGLEVISDYENRKSEDNKGINSKNNKSEKNNSNPSDFMNVEFEDI
tara:strand:+ start:513 stop:899 length:387 start_codon:yes stop_codon:yes gene_type:complete